MIEWLSQFDGSIKYFLGAAYFNPACGDTPEKIVKMRSDDLFTVLRLPSTKYRRKAIGNLSQSLELKREKIRLLNHRLDHVGKTRMKMTLM